MKKCKYILFLIISLIFTSKIVYANDIKSINMDIYIDDSGNAHIKEIWNAKLNEGTEGYKPYYNLGNSEIQNFQVSMNGQNFQTVDYWDINGSFSDKSYKSGINKTADGLELCFGISKYGSNTYTLEYTISNFVVRTNDADVVYWTLIPHELSDKPESVYIKIRSSFPFSDTLDVWGYGYGDQNQEGYAYVYDGYIEMTKEGSLDSDESMVVLIKFPLGTFTTNNVMDTDFDYFHDMAEEGAQNYHKFSFWNFIVELFVVIFNILIYMIPFIVFYRVVKNMNRFGSKNLKFSKNAKKLRKVPYFRDLPCKKDIFAAYWVACQYNLAKNQTDFLGAILLKWLKNGNIENVMVSTGKKEEKTLKLIKDDKLNTFEKDLYKMMYEASIDGVLESNEFKKWCNVHYSEILKWFNNVIDDVTDKYVNSGDIIKTKKMVGYRYDVQTSLDEEAIKMAGLKKFLQEFSIINERHAIEVKLWQEYLMYAQIFGIAEQVAKEFKKLYPDVITDDYYNDVIFIHNISYTGVRAASAAKSRAESYSSGGGGFSSSGGGGGSFGGGGGGGGFR